jgi:hypothetical protein
VSKGAHVFSTVPAARRGHKGVSSWSLRLRLTPAKLPSRRWGRDASQKWTPLLAAVSDEFRKVEQVHARPKSFSNMCAYLRGSARRPDAVVGVRGH